MSTMTYRDIPVLRSAGFVAGEWGQAWYKRDKNGTDWIVYEDEQSANLIWNTRPVILPSHTMTRAQFQELFG